MASTGPRPNFSSWPDVTVWHIDDKLAYGTWECRSEVEGLTFYASGRTLEDLSRYRLNYVNGLPIPAVPAKDKKTREAVLDEAKSLVVGDRNAQYGEPYDDFKKVADALNAYGFSGPNGRKIMPRDVPFFQILVKLSRLIPSPSKMDSWIDIAGYAACGAEVAEVEVANNERR